MKSIEGVLNLMTAKLVRSTGTEFEPDALEEWAKIFNRTVRRNLTQNGLSAWTEEASAFVLRNVALTARKAANMAQAREEDTISADILCMAADTEIARNRKNVCKQIGDSGEVVAEEGPVEFGVWCPDGGDE